MTTNRQSRIAALQAKVDRIARAPILLEESARERAAATTSAESWSFISEGLPAACIHEIEGVGADAEDGIAPTCFAGAMLAHVGEGAIFWIVRHDAPFAPRLAAFGLDLNRVIFCSCRNDAEALAALEDVLRAKGVAAAVGEVGQVKLVESRRLHLVAEQSGATGILLRRRFHGTRARKVEGSAAVTRWRVHFAPTRGEEMLLGPPRWRLDLLYCRGRMPASYIAEWDDEARRLHLVAQLADHETVPDRSGLRRAG